MSDELFRFEHLTPFKTEEEVKNYLDREQLECLICGKFKRNLALHLLFKHNIAALAYKEKLALPHTRGLVGLSTATLMAERVKQKGGLFKPNSRQPNRKAGKQRQSAYSRLRSSERAKERKGMKHKR